MLVSDGPLDHDELRRLPSFRLLGSLLDSEARLLPGFRRILPPSSVSNAGAPQPVPLPLCLHMDDHYELRDIQAVERDDSHVRGR